MVFFWEASSCAVPLNVTESELGLEHSRLLDLAVESCCDTNEERETLRVCHAVKQPSVPCPDA